MAELLDGLNEPQRQAVTTTTGPLLVLAGAGSGKTRVITRRAAYIASTVASPREVLAITFTNKAAGEMQQRIAALGFGQDMIICTFHSLGVRLLRWFSEEAGIAPTFTIFDEGDRRQVVRKAIEDAGLATTQWTPAMVQTRISDAKNQLITAEQYAERAASAEFVEQTIARIYRSYERLMAAQQALDFDDLLCRPAFLLGEHPHVRQRLEQRFRYVLIDEYQDTNHSQYMIARGLTLQHENICATGDPDQSIYAWRGADIRNILEFEQDFPNAQVVHLEQNYRSTQRILSAAGSLISANRQRKEKSLWTQNAPGPAVRVVELEDAEREAEFIVREIGAHQRSGGSLNDAAVFYRVNALTRVLEEAFLRAGISYQVARGTEFYNRKEIKDLLAYLRILVNPADNLALARSINTPARGIGKSTLERLAAHARGHELSLLGAARRLDEISGLKRTASKIRSYLELLDGLQECVEQPADAAIERVLSQTGLLPELQRSESYGPDATENVNELISAAADFMGRHDQGTLADWLQHVSLVSDVDGVDRAAGAVTLMTLHAAKGLEFPRVHVIGLEDGLLPHENCKDDPAQLEEERRLCFVGMTRAQRELILSHARWRMIRGATRRGVRSEFLSELPRQEIEWHSEVESAAPGRGPEHERPPQGDYSAWRRGMYLRHPSFGVGQLLWKQPTGRQTRAGVRFPAYGEKTLILEHAKMRPVDTEECQLEQEGGVCDMP